MNAPAPSAYARLAAARLPSLPQALLRVLELAERDDVGLADLSALIGQDPALSARVLSSANSAAYNRGRAFNGLAQCVSVLGASQVRRITLNQSVAALFGQFKTGGAMPDMRVFWHHALCMAVLTRQMAARIGYAHAEEAYLAGLLHDIGQLALRAAMPAEYRAALADADDELDLMPAERAHLGLDHAEAGAWLAMTWGMHSFFADALRYHHEPLARIRDAHPLTQCVALAEWLSLNPAAPGAVEGAEFAPWPGLQVETLTPMLAAADMEARQIAESLGLELPSAETLASLAAQRVKKSLAATRDAAVHEKLAAITQAHLDAQSALADLCAPGVSPSAAPRNTAAETRPGEAAAHALLDAARMLFGAPRAAWWRLDGQRLRLQPALPEDAPLDGLALTLPDAARDSALARAATGEIASAHLGTPDLNLADSQWLRAQSAESLLCIPLRAADETPEGVLALGLSRPQVEALSQQPVLLKAFAREASAHLRQARRAAGSDAERQALEDAFQLRARKLVHEVNNPLGVVRNYLALLRGQMADNAAAQDDLDLVESELRRVARLLRDYRQTGAHAQPSSGTDLNALIEQVLRTARVGRPDMAGLDVRLELAPDLPTLAAAADPLRQAVLNLVFNAADAMPQGGVLRITTRWLDAARVELRIADSGPGLPAAVRERLFQPVQSHKGGAHQGLGLSIVHELITRAGGSVDCRSPLQPGLSGDAPGTEFILVLPCQGA